MPSRPIIRLRKLCLALSEAHEVEAWGEPTFRVRNKMFAMYANAANHHGNGRYAVWVKAAPGDQATMVGAAPHASSCRPIWDRAAGSVSGSMASSAGMMSMNSYATPIDSSAQAARPFAGFEGIS